MAVPARRLATWEDLWDLAGEERRYEVVNGEVVEKAAGDLPHGTGQIGVAGLLWDRFSRRSGGGSPGGWWLRTEVDIEFERHEVYRPDVSGWRRDRVPILPQGFPVRIAPDWVCEVLSKSTAHRDLGVKMDVFHRHRVGHYWVVDPLHEVLVVYRWGEEAYQRALTAGAADTVRAEPFDAIELFVGRLFGVDPPEE